MLCVFLQGRPCVSRCGLHSPSPLGASLAPSRGHGQGDQNRFLSAPPAGSAELSPFHLQRPVALLEGMTLGRQHAPCVTEVEAESDRRWLQEVPRLQVRGHSAPWETVALLPPSQREAFSF